MAKTEKKFIKIANRILLRQEDIIFVLAEFLLEGAEAWQPPPHIKKHLFFCQEGTVHDLYTPYILVSYTTVLPYSSSNNQQYSHNLQLLCTAFSMGLDKHILTSQSQYKYKRPIVCVEIIYKMCAHVCIN